MPKWTIAVFCSIRETTAVETSSSSLRLGVGSGEFYIFKISGTGLELYSISEATAVETRSSSFGLGVGAAFLFLKNRTGLVL